MAAAPRREHRSPGSGTPARGGPRPEPSSVPTTPARPGGPAAPAPTPGGQDPLTRRPAVKERAADKARSATRTPRPEVGRGPAPRTSGTALGAAGRAASRWCALPPERVRAGRRRSEVGRAASALAYPKHGPSPGARVSLPRSRKGWRRRRAERGAPLCRRSGTPAAQERPYLETEAEAAGAPRSPGRAARPADALVASGHGPAESAPAAPGGASVARLGSAHVAAAGGRSHGDPAVSRALAPHCRDRGWRPVSGAGSLPRVPGAAPLESGRRQRSVRAF